MARPENETIEARKRLAQNLILCKKKPSKFAELFLHYKPYEYNIAYLDCMEQRVIYRTGRKTGKTYSTATKVLHFAWFAPFLKKTVTDVCEILIVAPTQNQANIMFSMIKTMAHRDETFESFIIKEKADEMWISFINGRGVTKIYTRAAGERGDSIRGYVPHIIIADEVAFMRKDVLIALLPAGIATNALWWITSTPYGRSGFLFEKCLESKPGNEGAKSCCSDKEESAWIQFHATSLMNPEPSEDYFKELEMVTQDQYQQEVMGEFLDIGNALIARKFILAAMGDYSMPDRVNYAMGVDVSGKGKDETVYCVIAYDQKGNVYGIETVAQASSSTIDVVETIYDIYRKYRGVMDTIYVDSTGLGAGVVDLALEKGIPVRGVVFSYESKLKMYQNLVILFERGKVKLGGFDPKMAYQLGYLKKDQTDSKRTKILSEEHDDYPDAMALACKVVDSGESWHVIVDDAGKPLNMDDVF